MARELTEKCKCAQAHAQIEDRDLRRAANFSRWMVVKIADFMARNDEDNTYVRIRG